MFFEKLDWGNFQKFDAGGYKLRARAAEPHQI